MQASTPPSAEAPPRAAPEAAATDQTGRADPAVNRGSAPPRPTRIAGALGRWVFLLFLFFYLMAWAMTLFEIDAFQTLVAQMTGASSELGARAGSSRQREILQAVRSVDPNAPPEPDPGAPDDASALYARLAARLDPLQVAIDLLHDIGTSGSLAFAVREDEAFRRAQRDAFRELTSRIDLAVIDLEKQVEALHRCEGTGDAACRRVADVRRDLETLERAVAELDGLLPPEEQTVTPSPPEARAPGSDTARRRARMQALAENIREQARALEQRITNLTDDPAQAEAARMRAVAATLGEQIDMLQELQEEPLQELITASYPSEAHRPETGVATAKPLARISAYLALGTVDPQVSDLRRILRAHGIASGQPERFAVEIPDDEIERETMDATLERLVKAFQGGTAPDGVVGPDTRARLNAVVDQCNARPRACGLGGPASPPPEPSPQSERVRIEDDIGRMRGALRALERFVARQEGIDLDEIGGLTRQLARIEVAARRLAELDIRVESPEGVADDGDGDGARELLESRRKYQQATLDLAGAVNAMRRILDSGTGIIAVADAIGDDDPLAHRKATTILREYQALDRYQGILTPLSVLTVPVPDCGRGPDEVGSCAARTAARLWNRLANIGFHGRDMATMTRQALDMMVVFVMGAIGSLIYLIRYLLGQTLLLCERGDEPVQGPPVPRPWSWYVFRPLFGIVVAFAIFLLYKTGQVALGGGSTNVLSSDVNLPILSIFSLFAGLLSWQALEMVESKGRRWLGAQKRENLWATSLRQALRHAGKNVNDCAAQVGVTPVQVERWIAGQDRVTPEMQDRIITWLDRSLVEIFSTTNPRDVDEGALRWATGLKGVLKSNRAGIDVPRLAQLVGQDVETVQAWTDLKRRVDGAMQLKIRDVLDVPMERLFTAERPDAEQWAVGLRSALHRGGGRYKRSDELAAAIGTTRQTVRRYMELKDPVPGPVQPLLAEALEIDQGTLLSPDRPLDAEYRWAAKLRECMRQAGIDSAAELADRIDTEAAWVRSWMEQEVCGEEDPPYCGQVAPATQLILTGALDCDSQTLFRAERANGDFRWVVMPRFADLVERRGGIGDLTTRLDLDAGRIERWMSGQEPVAPDTQLALISDLRLTVEDLDTLFTNRPPPDPSRPQSTLWATGLRAAVRSQAGLRTLGRLAGELDVPAQSLYDQAEQLEPVPMELRDRILAALGPLPGGTEPPFSNRAPNWADFRWAPGLRSALAERGMQAEELASALDVDLPRVLDWIEMDTRPVGTRWAQDRVKRGQLCPDSCDAVLAALGGVVDHSALFSSERPQTGMKWAVVPTFGLAVHGFEGQLNGFADLIDAAPDRVERWIAQQEPVGPSTQARILEVLGLAPEDEPQLFDAEKRERDAVG